ncbi:MAG: hypothetical protein OEV78_12590 [Spirochaetia bacterium]|nr:hypothetical protein [Spirochaetia bacterium]
MSFQDINWDLLQNQIHQSNADFSEIFKLPNWIISFSGGADSVLALATLISLHRYKNIPRKIIIFYLDHGEKFSIEEQNSRNKIFDLYNSILKNEHNIELEIKFFKKNVHLIARKIKTSFEYTGSQLRLRLLKNIVKNFPDSIITTGHNLSDWYETVIMRLNRGCSPDKLVPLELFKNSFSKFYPLAKITRDEVRNLCRYYHLPYWDDPGNTGNKNMRARIRNISEITNPSGLRKTAENFIIHFSQQNPIDKYKHIIITTREHREYRIALKELQLIKNSDTLIQSIFKELSLWPQSASIKNGLKNKSFHFQAYHMEIENWNGTHYMIFRRGLSRLPGLYKHCETNIITGDQISKKYFIQLAYGKKIISKIFSENKISKRQRKLVICTLSEENKNEIIKLDMRNIGLKTYSKYTG